MRTARSLSEIPESEVEDAAVEAAEAAGIVAIKLNLRNRRDWPDRLFLGPGACVLFVEYKRWGEEPRKAQWRKIRLLRALGFEAEIDDRKEEAVERIRTFARRCRETVVAEEAGA